MDIYSNFRYRNECGEKYNSFETVVIKRFVAKM